MSSSPVPSSREVSGLDAQRPLLATLRRHRRLGAFTQDPRELEALTGLPFDQLAAVAPGLRSFAHAGRQLVFIEVVGSALAGPETAPTFSALRRCLGHAIDYGYGHWPKLRCVFTPAVAELVENLIPSLQRRRDPRRELAEHLATTQLR
ncbi:MAG TPA: hypothetical protein PK095_12270, partial [Myxococcota bacterium]|nr:hypothetical protein [Myxococcota bacterium]